MKAESNCPPNIMTCASVIQEGFRNGNDAVSPQYETTLIDKCHIPPPALSLDPNLIKKTTNKTESSPPPRALIVEEEYLVPLRGQDTTNNRSTIDLNLPPLKTPQNGGRSIRQVDPTAFFKYTTLSTNDMLKRYPKPPLPKNKDILRRCRSLGSETLHEATKDDRSGDGSRRSIFGNYWDSKETGKSQQDQQPSFSGSCVSPANLTRTVSAPPSLSHHSMDAVIESYKDIYLHTPSKEELSSVILDRFSSVQALDPVVSSTLPPLPAPMLRFCGEGPTTSLAGMYPLITPVSILKKGRYHGNNDSKECGETKQGSFNFSSSPSSSQVMLNLTQSIAMNRETKLNLIEQLTDTSSCPSDDTDTLSKSNHGSNRQVTFDPRVTVSEYEDHVQRDWFRVDELEELKYETISLAQQYFLAHPEVAQQYRTPFENPFTGTQRRKALYSLPVLSLPIEEYLPGLQKCEAFLNEPIKQILIVDANKATLVLYVKAMERLFPGADIVATQDGQEAVAMVAATMQNNETTVNCFDIIVMEQRVYHPKSPSATNSPNNSETEGPSEATSAVSPES